MLPWARLLLTFLFVISSSGFMFIKSSSLKRSDRSVSSWFPVVQSIFTFNSLIYLEIILVIDGGIKDPNGKAKRQTGEAGWLPGTLSSFLMWWLPGSH